MAVLTTRPCMGCGTLGMDDDDLVCPNARNLCCDCCGEEH